MDSRFLAYRRKGVTYMRPYEPGEDLTGVSVSERDTPELGGMIAQNPEDENDRWYVNPVYFNKNLELAD